jgi:hypothetical protein
MFLGPNRRQTHLVVTIKKAIAGFTAQITEHHKAPSLLVFFIVARQDTYPNLNQFSCVFLALFHLLFAFSVCNDLHQLPRTVLLLVDVISPKFLTQCLFLFVYQRALRAIGWL